MKVLVAIKDERDCQIIGEMIKRLTFSEEVEFVLLHTIPELPHTAKGAVIPELIAKTCSESRLQALEVLRPLAAQLNERTRVHLVVSEGKPVEEIISMANRWQVELIVLGSGECMRRGISFLYPCSVSLAVVSLAPCAVLVARERDDRICVDQSDKTRSALVNNLEICCVIQ